MEHTPKEEEILEVWLKKHRKDGQYIDGGNNYVEYSLDGCFNLHALVSSIRREAIAETGEKILDFIWKNRTADSHDGEMIYVKFSKEQFKSHLTQE